MELDVGTREAARRVNATFARLRFERAGQAGEAWRDGAVARFLTASAS